MERLPGWVAALAVVLGTWWLYADATSDAAQHGQDAVEDVCPECGTYP